MHLGPRGAVNARPEGHRVLTTARARSTNNSTTHHIIGHARRATGLWGRPVGLSLRLAGISPSSHGAQRRPLGGDRARSAARGAEGRRSLGPATRAAGTAVARLFLTVPRQLLRQLGLQRGVRAGWLLGASSPELMLRLRLSRARRWGRIPPCGDCWSAGSASVIPPANM